MTCVTTKTSQRWTFRSSRSRASAALAALMMAAACATAGPPDRLPTERYKITVEETRALLELPVVEGQFALNRDQRADLRAFAAAYRARGHGPITIALPAGGPRGDLVLRNAAEARAILAEQGIELAALDGASYDARTRGSDAPIVAYFTAYEAIAPECHQAWDDFSFTLGGANTLNFGCASQANLAAMIADPADLLGPRTLGPSDTARRASILEKYREGETTATQRSDDETATVSNAVE